jgi:uncharacterized protein YkwD
VRRRFLSVGLLLALGATAGVLLLSGGSGDAVATAAAEKGFFVGFSEDAIKFAPEGVAPVARALGAGGFRITLLWEPGQRAVGADDSRAIAEAVAAAGGMRVVLAVYAESGGGAPLTEEAQDAYCAYVRDALARHPQIEDAVIWNEPNKSHFWRPQFNADGSSAAPEAYARLLARCWDVLHALRADVNVVAPATSPRGNDRPDATSNVSHSPGNFIRKLGDAYRAMGRQRPLLDTVGHHVYGEHSAERPWKQHRLSNTIGLGDWGELMQALWDAFDRTGQPIPGECAGGRCVGIWYMEAGYQTTVDEHKAGIYVGRINEKYPIPDWGGGEPSTQAPGEDSPAPDQGTQVTDAVRLAYCQPYVEAFFNFLLVDESRLEGWQSGALWADRTPKDSYEAFDRVIHEASSAAVDCARLKGGRLAPAFKPSTTVEILRVEWPKARRFHFRNDEWRFRLMTGEDARYHAALNRLGGSPAREAVARADGELKQGRFALIRFPARRLGPGVYQIEVQLVGSGNVERAATRASPTFRVKAPPGKKKTRGSRKRPPEPMSAIQGLPAPSELGVEPSAGRVLLSEIPVLVAATELGAAPQLGAPRPLPSELLQGLEVKLADPERIEGAVVAEINRVRRRFGLGALRASSDLARAGDAHARSLALAGLFTHDWPDRRPFGKWIEGFYASKLYRTWAAGENLLWTSGTLTPRDAVQLWLDSPAHRRILLSRRWREVGLGVVRAFDAPGAYGGLDVFVAAAEFGMRR